MSRVPEQPPQIDGIDRRQSGSKSDLTFVCPDCDAAMEQMQASMPGMLGVRCTNPLCRAELDIPLVTPLGGTPKILPGGKW